MVSSKFGKGGNPPIPRPPCKPPKPPFVPPITVINLSFDYNCFCYSSMRGYTKSGNFDMVLVLWPTDWGVNEQIGDLQTLIQLKRQDPPVTDNFMVQMAGPCGWHWLHSFTKDVQSGFGYQFDEYVTSDSGGPADCTFHFGGIIPWTAT